MHKNGAHRTKSMAGIWLACLAVIFFSVPTLAQSPKWKKYEAEGDTLYKRKEFAKAVKPYTRAIAESKLADKESQKILYKRAFCYYTEEKYQLALNDLKEFSGYYPESGQPWVLMAFVYRALEYDENQLKCLGQALQFQSGNPDLLKWRSMLYLQKGEYQLSKADASAAIALQDDPEAQTYLGLDFFNLNQRDSAFIAFNHAIELDATYLAAYLYAGSAALQDGKFELSIEYLNLALRLDPHSKEALFYKGVALVESKKIDEGCRCLNRAFYAGYDDAGDYLTEYCFGVEN